MDKKRQTLLVLFLISTLLSLVISCPPKCGCDYKKTETKCNSKNITNDQLYDIAKNIPLNTTVLSFIDNLITELPVAVFANLKDLTKISLSRNKIVVLPSNISAFFPKLINLDLSKNEIAQIRDVDFNGYENVLVLDLYRNQISELPEEVFTHAKRLETLYLDDNKITSISKRAFTGLYNLNKLFLQENFLSKIEQGSFDDLPLIELDVSKNKLTAIPSYFVRTKKLVSHLSLNENNISKIEENAFFNLTIDNLHLKNNSLTVLTKEMFTNSSLRLLLDLTENHLICNCFMFEYIKSLSTKHISGSCSAPPIVAGQDLQTFKENNNVSCTVCSTGPCKHNGTCKLLNETDFQCECEKGFIGELCQSIDYCYDDPCKRNSTCSLSNNSPGFSCECEKDIKGTYVKKKFRVSRITVRITDLALELEPWDISVTVKEIIKESFVKNSGKRWKRKKVYIPA